MLTYNNNSAVFLSLLLIKTDNNQSTYFFKNRTEKNETAAFAIKTDRNRNGKLKPLRPNENN